MTEEIEEEVTEGIILDIDFGYGMKYSDPDNLYLKLNIQQFNGYESVQLFRQEKVGKLLLQFKQDYSKELSVNQLKHRRCFLHYETTNGVPNAIAVLPPSKFPQYSWIENDDWN